ncbi:MAG: response regulator [Planctomycetota bacterium]
MSKRDEVLVVDDSPLVRACLTELGRQPDVEVVGLAPDPFVARDLLLWAKLTILLDLEMPRMDGLTFPRKIMRQADPTIVVKAHHPAGRQRPSTCLEIGAFDALQTAGRFPLVQDLVGDILERVRSIDATVPASEHRSAAARSWCPSPADRSPRPTRSPPSAPPPVARKPCAS